MIRGSCSNFEAYNPRFIYFQNRTPHPYYGSSVLFFVYKIQLIGWNFRMICGIMFGNGFLFLHCLDYMGQCANFIFAGDAVMNWIPMSELNDNEIIWSGRRVRLYNVGLNVTDSADDFYEYFVSEIYGNNEYFQLTCLSQGKAGNIICVIKKELPDHYALGKELKRMMGVDNTFVESV